MPIESLPTFTKPARDRWESIPADIRQRLLSNVWCGHCRFETTISNFSGAIKCGDLLLVGKCAECRSDVARVIKEIESGRLPHRKVGSHRRIAFGDLIAYARKMREQQAGALDRMADNARELGLEY